MTEIRTYGKVTRQIPKAEFSRVDATRVRTNWRAADQALAVAEIMSNDEARAHSAALLAIAGSGATPTPTPPNPPATPGVYQGGRIGYPDTGDFPWMTTALTRYETHIGKEISYAQFGQPLGRVDKNALETCRRLGIIPQMEFMLKAPADERGTQMDNTGTSWHVRDAASGMLDSRIRYAFEEMKAWGGLMVLRPHWEPNGPWMDSYYNWCHSYVHSNPDLYVQMWRRWRTIFLDVFKGVATPNVKWLWCPNWWNASQSGAKEPTPWHPGADQYDVVGLNGYADYATIDTILGPTLKRLQELAPGKPIYWETGVCKTGGNNHPPPTGMTAEAWVKDVFAKLPNYPIRIFQWFQDSEGTRDSTAIEQSPEVLAAIKTGLSNSRYLGQSGAL